MRRLIFTCVLRMVGVPMILVKWILKAIWFLTYGAVGLLYKLSFIYGSKSGKVAYTAISTTLLICAILMACAIKK